MHDFDIITAGLSISQTTLLLKHKLRLELPTALPLYRRCQYHLREVKQQLDVDSSGEVWVAVCKPEEKATITSEAWLDIWCSQGNLGAIKSGHTEAVTRNNRLQQQWLAAYIDLQHPGEVQVELYGSWESETTLSPKLGLHTSTAKSPERAALFRSLYRHLRTEHVPRLPIAPPRRWQSLRDSGKLLSVPYRRSNVLFGSVSEHLFPYLEDGIVNEKLATTNPSRDLPLRSCWSRSDLTYLKFTMDFPVSLSEAKTPPGFRFGPLRDQHFQLMLDRSVIPRTIELLRSLVSVGLFLDNDRNDPIAWGILSKDGAISSLHTETEYRGKGLAEYVSRELSRIQGSVFRSDWFEGSTNDRGIATDVSYSHSDVAENNVASRRVFEKLGGEAHSRVGYVAIDLDEFDR